MTLSMATKLQNGCPNNDADDFSKTKLKVTMVRWSLDDNYVITAVSDFSIKLWDSSTGELVRVMLGHNEEVFVIEMNPTDPRIVLTAGHDGTINLWSIPDGTLVRSFVNNVSRPQASRFPSDSTIFHDR